MYKVKISYDGIESETRELNFKKAYVNMETGGETEEYIDVQLPVKDIFIIKKGKKIHYIIIMQ